MESKDEKIQRVSYEYPEELMDHEGYPTSEALRYIKNWSIHFESEETQVKSGIYFGKGMYQELIDYVNSIWIYDTFNYEDGLLEIHTMGWSGNEEIIAELKLTDLWMHKFRCHQTGGHYFFSIDGESEFDWQVVKQKIDKK